MSLDLVFWMSIGELIKDELRRAHLMKTRNCLHGRVNDSNSNSHANDLI